MQDGLIKSLIVKKKKKSDKSSTVMNYRNG